MIKINYQENVKGLVQLVSYFIIVPFVITSRYDIGVYTIMTKKIWAREKISVLVVN